MAQAKKASNPRDGVVSKPGKDAPAKLRKGRAKPPKDFDAAWFCEALDLYWENDGGDSFVVRGDGGLWSKWPMKSIVKLAKLKLGFDISTECLDGERVCQMDQVLLYARQCRCVESVLPALAGYKSGKHELSDGRVVIVRNGARLVVPEKGDWAMIKAFIEGRLNLGDGDMDQAVYFHAWCKIALESLLFGEPGSYKPGHLMVLSGPVGCGKSRLQINIITPLLGGRKADPTSYILGEDNFNADMMGAEHLMMEELLTSSWNASDRVRLSEAMKRLVATESKRMRLMRTDPLTVEPFWRTSLSMNNDPDKLRAFPMLTGDFADKVVMLLVASRPLPMPTRTASEQKAFNDQIRAELPAYAYWLLNEFEIPEAMLSVEGKDATRFGFASFQHPALATQLFDDTPAAQLLRLIDQADFTNMQACIRKLWEMKYPLNTSGHKPRGKDWVNQPGVWRGTAEELENLLCGHDDMWQSNVARAASRLIGKSGASNMLSRLKEQRPDRFAKSDRTKDRGWEIARPTELDEPLAATAVIDTMDEADTRD